MQQPVEFLVGDLRIVVDVVALFVVANRLAQLADAVGRRFHRSRESDVVGQRQQRVALGAWRERVERFLGALGVFDGTTQRVLDRVGAS